MRAKTMFAAVGLAAALAVGSASAQQQEGLVNVMIEDIEVLKDVLDVEETNVVAPVTVQVGLGVAAQVCGVAANVLAEKPRTETACTLDDAGKATQAFRQAVRQQVGA